MIKSTAVIFTIATAVSIAAADTQVWFSTPNVNGNSPGDSGGAPGEDLSLFCETGVGVCEWQISIMATQTGGLWIGYGMDLVTQDPGNPKNLSGSNAQLGATNPFDIPQSLSPGIAGPGPGLLIGASGGTFGGGIGPGTFEMVTFTLSKPKDLEPGTFGTIVGQDGDFPWGQDGPFGQPEPHEYARIVVTNVPEPESVILLGVSVVCAAVSVNRPRKVRSRVSGAVESDL